jgi:hypothetical protein
MVEGVVLNVEWWREEVCCEASVKNGILKFRLSTDLTCEQTIELILNRN